MASATVNDEELMREALEEARLAGLRNEVPIGAVLSDKSGQILAKDGNRVCELSDPSAHAEILALRRAGALLQNERLNGTTLFVTLEPCAMCAAALSFARVERIVFAADDPKGGAVLHGPRFFGQPTCHHRPAIEQKGDASAAGALLKEFFRARR